MCDKIWTKRLVKALYRSEHEVTTEGTSEFEKDFFKLMNNSVYGKTIENVLKRQDIKFCCERKKALRYVMKINFKRKTIFTKNLVALHMIWL